jgi:hypothetical protein
MDAFASHFSRNDDGSWTCTKAGTFQGPNGRIQVTPGSRFYPGTEFMGFDMAAWLDAHAEDRADERQQPRGERRRGERRSDGKGDSGIGA